MAQEQTKLPRFAGPSLIHDLDHLSGIPQVQDDENRNDHQAQQGRSERNGSKNQGANTFEYQNPRQYS
jgi:hypothetical protein